MRDALKWTMGWLWVAAFLALPNCTFNPGGLGPPLTSFNPGTQPWGSAIFCDIESQEVARHCATAGDLSTGVPLAQAAIALVKEQSSNVGLDYSPAAITAAGCSPGQPVAITFRSPFPVGSSKCLNCGGVIGPVYANVDAACVDICKDLNPGPGGDAFCADPANVHRASTNASSCFNGACTGNALPMTFADPRRTPEAVIWTNRIGTGVSGADSNSLSRTAATTIPANPADQGFDAGATSTQTITRGDGYLEFGAAETNLPHACGLSSNADAPETTPSLSDIGFSIDLNLDDHVYIVESASVPGGFTATDAHLTYAVGDRFRVNVKDNFDGTANITYCVIPAGSLGVCDGTPFGTAVRTAHYPFRVDASFRDFGATLTDVRIVRIK